MEFNYYEEGLNENVVGMVTKIIKQVISAPEKFKKELKSNFNKMIDIIQDMGIENEYFYVVNSDTKLAKKKLKSITTLKSLRESQNINEDFKNFLKFWKSETYPALAIFPTLQIWFELDKLLGNAGLADLNYKKIFIYGTLWVIIVMGQHALLWKKWKKENPGDYETEGKPGIFRRGKKPTVDADEYLFQQMKKGKKK